MGMLNPVIKIFLLLSLVFSSTSGSLEAPKARIMVIGDVMMHLPIINSGYDTNTEEYHYENIFEKVKPIFSQADFVIGNLETPVANTTYSGYPRFNAPKEIVKALKDAGVNVLTTANNHAMDQSEQGLVQTLNHLDEYNIMHTGTFRSLKGKEKPLILEVNGIKIGIIATTYGTNGLPIPKPYLVNMLSEENIKVDVEILKKENVDYIMAMIHFGYEYHRDPSDEQKEWVKKLYENGVDFVLGSHPHVVQTLEIYKGNENESDRGVIYSLGNFLSNQRYDWKEYGIILDIILEKDYSSKKIKISSIQAIPTYVKSSYKDRKRYYKVLPILFAENDSVDKSIEKNGSDLVEHVFQYDKKN